MNYGVHEGECFGLLGPNGAGKSTTVSMLTRHTTATRGEGKVKGNSVNAAFLDAAKSLGVVTQDNTLYDELSAIEHLELFCKIRGVSEESIAPTVLDALKLMELEPHKMKQSQRLSGGMKRKLCTAMSLIGNPEVVLMDEPSAGLDPVSRRTCGASSARRWQRGL
jgi:ABC-type multidrug transport system ATPase subunit